MFFEGGGVKGGGAFIGTGDFVYNDYSDYELYSNYIVYRNGNRTNESIEATEKNTRVIWAACLQDAGENKWGHDEWFAVLLIGSHLGFIHYIPAGYSSYTYDPDVAREVHIGYTWEKFKNLVLTDDMRQHLGDVKYETIAVLFGSKDE